MDYTTFTKEALRNMIAERNNGLMPYTNKTKADLVVWLQRSDKLRTEKKAAEEREDVKETRELVLLRMADPDIKTLEYPYSYITDEDYNYGYRFEDIFKETLGYPVDKENVEGFPANIAETYWVRPGENDSDAWLVLGRLTTGPYFFYKAWCDYTGFDCQGGMDLYAADDWKGLLHRAMSSEDYEAYRAMCKERIDGEDDKS